MYPDPTDWADDDLRWTAGYNLGIHQDFIDSAKADIDYNAAFELGMAVSRQEI